MLIDFKDVPKVAMDFMNETHAEDVEIINEIYALIEKYDGSEQAIAKIDEAYTHWIEHTVDHFGTEEIEMQERCFPPYMMHKGEHDRALEEMREVFAIWQGGRNVEVLRNYFTKVVPNWLVHHISTMDTVTASFFATGMSPCGTGI